MEGSGANSGDRRLREVDRAQTAGGGEGARESHSGRAAVGGLHEFKSRDSDDYLKLAAEPVEKRQKTASLQELRKFRNACDMSPSFWSALALWRFRNVALERSSSFQNNNQRGLSTRKFVSLTVEITCQVHPAIVLF